MAFKVIILSGESFQSELVSEMKAKKSQGVCILFNKSASVVRKMLEKKGVKTGKVMFIDTVSPTEESDAIHIDPEDLTSLSIAITDVAHTVRGFVVFDSFNALTLHNPPKVVLRFAKFILSKLKKEGIDCTVFIDEDFADENLVAHFKESADKLLTH